jgi:hypothetical protein
LSQKIPGLEKVLAGEERSWEKVTSESEIALSDRKINRSIRKLVDLQKGLDELPSSEWYR